MEVLHGAFGSVGRQGMGEAYEVGGTLGVAEGLPEEQAALLCAVGGRVLPPADVCA